MTGPGCLAINIRVLWVIQITLPLIDLAMGILDTYPDMYLIL